ncbi:MAG TPA: L,D-transpeptidase [Cryomorphaceae bacterium]|nr:L,D-transpeptidase [Cryomorphaceae bacterium]
MSALRHIPLILALALCCHAQGQDPPRRTAMVDFLLEYLEVRYPDHHFDTFLYVAAKKQRMYHISDGMVIGEYTVSTSSEGIGSASGSFKTPDGLHRIAEKVGDDLPLNTIIVRKQSTGQLAEVIPDDRSTGQDLITTRVLHLDGLEEGRNKGENRDSYSRGIFIHGTHEEGRLGHPASKGCIRMSNREVRDLFQKVEVDTFVVILNN